MLDLGAVRRGGGGRELDGGGRRPLRVDHRCRRHLLNRTRLRSLGPEVGLDDAAPAAACVGDVDDGGGGRDDGRRCRRGSRGVLDDDALGD